MDWTVFVIMVECLAMGSVLSRSTTQEPNIGSLCQSKINRHKNTCYWLERAADTDTFYNMEQKCVSKGGNLATIDSKETSDFVIDFFNSLKTGHPWIGYEEPNPQWNDGSPFSWENYREGEPNNDHEACTSIVYKTGQWNDASCNLKEDGICQIHIIYGPDCLQTYQGSEYRGQISVTQDGKTCQAWASQLPHKHTYTDPTLFPDDKLYAADNNCRNPDNRTEGPWCYTTDEKVPWGFCDIPMCRPTDDHPANSPKPKECLMSEVGFEYVGQRSVTVYNRKCQAWHSQVPHAHDNYNPNSFPDSNLREAANYCRMPAGSTLATRPWCYTIDPYVEWEHCDIPLCPKDWRAELIYRNAVTKEWMKKLTYSDDDSAWVEGYLLPGLENRGFKVCFHRVHYLGGKSIIDNITECIAKSKKVLAFYSMNYIHSCFGLITWEDIIETH